MVNPYETQRLVDEYLLFHYGKDHEVLPWKEGPSEALDFAARTVSELLPENAGTERALDIGCAVGRSGFELSRRFDSVTAIDYSNAFIQAAQGLQADGQLPYQVSTEGALTESLVAHLPEGCHPARVQFLQGDAMDLPPDLAGFDVVHAANLICRLTYPSKFLQRLPDLVRSEGFVILTTPCTWLAEYTPPEQWPSGTTLEWLKGSLQNHFVLVKEKNLPFLIREHARKFQWSVALGTVWQRL